MPEQGSSAAPEDEPTRPSRQFRPTFDPHEAITRRRSRPCHPLSVAVAEVPRPAAHGGDSTLQRLLRRVARMLT